MYGHTFAQALCKLGGDELRLVYVLCCDTAVQELLVSKIRDFLKREPERFTAQLQEKVLAYREWSDDELRLAILLELAKRSRLHGAPLTTAAELEEFAGGIVEQIELGAAEEDRAYFTYREEHPESSALEALIDYQIEQWTEGLGRLLDAAPQSEWEEYIRRIEPLLPEGMSELWATAAWPNGSAAGSGMAGSGMAGEAGMGTAAEAGTAAGTGSSPSAAAAGVPPRGEGADLSAFEDRAPEWEPFGGEYYPPGIAESPGAAEALRHAGEAAPLPGSQAADAEWERALGGRSDSGAASTAEAVGAMPGVRLDKAQSSAAGGAGGDDAGAAGYEADGESERPDDAQQASGPPRPSGVKLLLAALESRKGYAYYETLMSLLAAAEGLLGIGGMPDLYGRRVSFLAVSASPVFLHVLPGGSKSAPRTLYRSLNPQRRRLPLLLVQLFLPELVSEDEHDADYEPMLALWRARAEQHGTFKSEIAEEDSHIDYYKRESASCAEQLEASKTERVGSEKRIFEIRGSLVDKLRASSMQLPYISDSFDRLLAEYADNRQRIADAENSRQERGQGFAGLLKYTLNYATSSVTLIDLRRKQDRLLERMADEALHNEGEWGQGERYVVAAERERIAFLDAEISRLEKLQAEYREQLRRSEQARKTLEQSKKKLEKQVYGLMDL